MNKESENKESVSVLIKEILNNTANIDNISIEYYRIGQREHCNIKIIPKNNNKNK